MALSKASLGRDERIVHSSRTHAKVLFLPAAALVVFTAALGIGIAATPPSWQPWGTWMVVALYVVLIGWVVIAPFVRWLTSTYTITDHRVATRKGVLNKTGHDLPLRRINNVNTERSLSDRILGCGTLVLETAAGKPLVLPDVPQVEKVHLMINELLFAHGDVGESLTSDE
ncbi:PH domain-containing protein [Tessaracoccus sp. OS52]|uniref:PH domain-containing protein n=1 Tax=Tessaracoccus sp. OS52 TaxID=2886691 RepID=UPI001D104A8C|nr:PH domain-containing protein [Tessaracoccus sp. OS52]MCC2592345.1 PH domain-containing protein [Tessaracoccus sp. OS52]